MQQVTSEAPASDATLQRTDELFREQHDGIIQRTDRLIARLMVFQWIAGIAAALWISPRAWEGTTSHIHLHVWAALFLGGAITVFPVLLSIFRPGKASTRHVIAAGQMLMSALLIHLMGGRIETHFHVFGSLAILAFYRDWRVLITATIVVATDHMLRGIFWPESVYGVLVAPVWRSLEHAGWVLFEDTFLIISIRQSLQEMRTVAERQAKLEALKNSIEQTVAERTAELTQEIAERKQAEEKLERTHRQLVDASRQAGMAEVATNVLHNVGNVLNSVNVSSSLIAERLRNSKVANLTKLAHLFEERKQDLAAFLTSDTKGTRVPGYLNNLAAHFAAEQTELLKEAQSLATNVEHIKEIVAVQQNYSKVSGMTEPLPPANLVEDALRMNTAALSRHSINVVREYDETPPVLVDRHKVLQILVNLIRNAKHALDDGERPDKQMTLRISKNGGDFVYVSVIDNGVGIPRENLTRIFEHGFTTRKDGHGFGLHSGALAAKELGGALTVHSDGPTHGAVFTLALPCGGDRKQS